MIILSEITRGDAFTIYAVKSDTATPCHDFLNTAFDENPNEHAKLMARLAHAAEHGPPRNKEQCRQLHGETGLYEFKTHKFRLFWFYDENRLIICSNGMAKSTAKEQKQAIATAARWKKDYQAAKMAGTVSIENES